MFRTFLVIFILISAFLAETSQGAIDKHGNEEDRAIPGSPPQINSIPSDSDSNEVTVDSKRSESSDSEKQSISRENAGDGAQSESKPVAVDDNASPKQSNAKAIGQTKDVNAINSFAQKMNQHILKSPQTSNKTGDITSTVIWSPFSVYQALVPLFYGADGETRRELQEILLPNQTQVSEKDQVIQFVTDLNQANPQADKQNEVSRNALTSATGLFARDDMIINPDYINLLQRNVKNVELKSIQFSNISSASESINSWAREKTNGLINEAVSENQMDAETSLMIVNCVRFKAPWQSQFDPKLTQVTDFYGTKGTQKVLMMNKIISQYYGEFPRRKRIRQDINSDTLMPPAPEDLKPFSVLEMPYKDTDLVTLFILPNSTDDIEKTMRYVDTMGVDRLRNELSLTMEVNLFMPKFKLSSDVNVIDALEKSGLQSLFSPSRANLSKIFAPAVEKLNAEDVQTESNQTTKSTRLIESPYLSKIIHRTIFETTEEGTSAGAVTSLSIIPLSAFVDHRSVEFKLDRPFILMLVKNKTIIFQGIVADLPGQDLNLKNVTSGEEVESSTRYNIGTTKSENGSSEDRAWWKRKGIPEYLKLNLTGSNNTKEPVAPSNVTSGSTQEDQNQVQEPLKISSPRPPPLFRVSPSPLPPNTFIQFSKYQQPEPVSPDGIRFPATYPVTRNKGHIRPRYDHYSQYYVRNILGRY